MMTPDLRRRLARVLGALVLLAGMAGLFVRHAPATTWSVPVQVGDLLDGWRVDDVRRTEFEVRVELSQGDEHLAVRWVDWSDATRPFLARVGHVTLLEAQGSNHRFNLPSPALITSMTQAVTARASAWPAPPAFVAPRTVAIPQRARVETMLAEGLIVLWLAALVACAPAIGGWLAHVGAGSWGTLGAIVCGQAAFVRWMGIGGAWHSNQHGFDRIADVEQGTPPAVAALGLLHGHGYYAVFQPLYELLGGRVGLFALSQLVTALALVGLFAWLGVLWGRARPALLGVAFAAALPIVLRLSASEDMYVPAMAWTCAALAFVEVWMRTGSVLALALAVVPSLLAMQTRAEMLVLMPAWIALGVVARTPDRLRAAMGDWRVWSIVLAASVALVPRGLAILASPPPADLRRTALDPMADPRLVVLSVLAIGLVVAHPRVRSWVGARITSPRVRLASGGALVLVVVLALVTYLEWLRAQGGPLQRTWQIHAAFDPSLVAPWVSMIAIAGLGIAVVRAPRRATVLGLSLVGALWIYLPQYDCLSTFVRTGMATVPIVAALAALALDAIVARAGVVPGAFVVAGLLGSGVVAGLPWMTARDAKAAYWDLVEQIRARAAPDTTIVWLSDDDADPSDRRRSGVHLDRARLDRHLGPGFDTASIRAWADREARAADGPGLESLAGRAYFARTPDCARLILADRGASQERMGPSWRYLDVSRLATTARIAVEGVDADWMDPGCRTMMERLGSPAWSTVPDPRNAGSVYETAVGSDTTIGLFPIEPRRGVRTLERSGPSVPYSETPLPKRRSRSPITDCPKGVDPGLSQGDWPPE